MIWKSSLGSHYLRPFALFFLTTLLWFWPHPALAKPNFETQVLEVIRNHPEVVVEAFEAYQRQQEAERDATRQAFLEQLDREPETLIGQSPTTHSLENRVVLLEFSDFQCPFCARAHDTVQEFLAQHPDDVMLVYKHFPLAAIHPQAIPAAQAAYAAQQQGQFWAYHDALFAHQDELGEDFYLDTARQLGLDLEQFAADRANARPAIEADLQLVKELGLNGTPNFFFQGHMLAGAVPLTAFEELLTQSTPGSELESPEL
ncbi:MAG: thioredoxin domain-containing protein [Spirulina sp. SIO3F2]|nr:thioredoxin domain-containing protein [Spirulina sp. SIO3F2]